MRYEEAEENEINEAFDRIDAQRAKIARLLAEIARLRAALDEIVRNGDQGIHVPGPYDIAKVALAKEGK